MTVTRRGRHTETTHAGISTHVTAPSAAGLGSRSVAARSASKSARVLLLKGSKRTMRSTTSNRGVAIVLGGGPFRTRNNKRVKSDNMLRKGDNVVSVRSAGGLPSNVMCYVKAMARNIVSANRAMGAIMSQRQERSVTHGRANARLLRTTLHEILNDRIGRTNSLILPRGLHFSFA